MWDAGLNFSERRADIDGIEEIRMSSRTSTTAILCAPPMKSFPGCSRQGATDLEDIQAIDDAIRVLNQAAREASNGSTAVWRIIEHARRYLETQITMSLSDVCAQEEPSFRTSGLSLGKTWDRRASGNV
jgi:hypothetical protein